MEDLLPFERYREAALGKWENWRRLALVSGGFFGIGMSVFFVWLGRGEAIALSVAVGLACGVAFGLYYGWSMRKRLLKGLRAVYDGSGRYAAPPPADSEPRYRLPASWIKSPGLAVGGVLYVVPPELTFVPHSMNLPSRRQPFGIRCADGCSLDVVPQPLTAWQRLLVPKPPPVLRVQTSDVVHDFLVPVPAEVRDRLRDAGFEAP